MIRDKRHTGLDLLRITAFLSVVSVHFFLKSGFYEQTVAGPEMYLMVVLRNLFMICVPLFLLLSGMVMGGKRPTAHYYVGVVKVVCIYVFASLCCGVYRIVGLKEELSAWDLLRGITSFSLAEYGWYIEMYLGLYLLIPFLNLAYDALHTQKGKKILLAVMLMLTALPGVVNIWRVDGLDWWLRPSSIQHYHQILPEFWTSAYPLTYFFLGRYLREHPMKISKPMNLGLILAVTLANGAFNYYRSYGSVFIWGGWQAWGALPNVVLAALVANFFGSLSCEQFPDKLKRIVSTVSNWVLGAYLVSWIFDSGLNILIRQRTGTAGYPLAWFPVIVLSVAICALALSAVVYGIYSVTGGKLLKWLRNKMQK